jgi:hypothetical protein
MSRILSISLLLSLFLSTGCMILDELDAANAKMKSMSKTQEKAEDKSSESVASKALKTKNELLQQSKQWWNEATSLSPTAVDSSIVSCRIQGSTQFMSKDDCLVRGGVPQGVSG